MGWDMIDSVPFGFSMHCVAQVHCMGKNSKGLGGSWRYLEILEWSWRELDCTRLGSTRLDSTGLDWIGLELMRRALEWMEDSGFSHVKFYFGVWGLGFG